MNLQKLKNTEDVVRISQARYIWSNDRDSDQDVGNQMRHCLISYLARVGIWFEKIIVIRFTYMAWRRKEPAIDFCSTLRTYETVSHNSFNCYSHKSWKSSWRRLWTWENRCLNRSKKSSQHVGWMRHCLIRTGIYLRVIGNWPTAGRIKEDDCSNGVMKKVNNQLVQCTSFPDAGDWSMMRNYEDERDVWMSGWMARKS